MMGDSNEDSDQSIAESLIELINVTIPTSVQLDDSLVEFSIRDGWRVVVFYDCGGFDYIDSFVSPEGNVIDFWDWTESSDRKKLVEWSPS